MTYKKKSSNILDISKRAFQWSHYQGGLPLVFIMFGFVFTGVFSILSYWFGYNWVVLVIGIIAIIIGMFLEYFPSNKK